MGVKTLVLHKPYTNISLDTMLHTTRGIVLHHMKYSETSIIVKIFTEKLGKQSFLIPGVRKLKAKHANALFQPLVPLELEMYYRKNASLQRVVEVKQHIPITDMLCDIKKVVIVTFLAELLNKALYDELQNTAVFDCLLQAIIAFNKLQEDYEAFYLRFMLHLCRHLGFGCTYAIEINRQLRHAGYKYYLSNEEISFLDQLLDPTLPTTTYPSKASLNNMLMSILKYMQLHIDNLHTLKSLSVLQELNR